MESFFLLMIRGPPRSTQRSSSAASDVYKRQLANGLFDEFPVRDIPDGLDGPDDVPPAVVKGAGLGPEEGLLTLYLWDIRFDDQQIPILLQDIITTLDPVIGMEDPVDEDGAPHPIEGYGVFIVAPADDIRSLICILYTYTSPRARTSHRMRSSA